MTNTNKSAHASVTILHMILTTFVCVCSLKAPFISDTASVSSVWQKAWSTVSCPCLLSIKQSLNVSSTPLDILIRRANLHRTLLPQSKFNVTLRDAAYLTKVHAVHTIQIPVFGLVRVDVTGDGVRVQVTSSIKSGTCPSLLPEHSVQNDEEDERDKLVPRIIGGDLAHEALIPYLARITSPSEKQWLMCSGVMISPIHVLTAAHCLPSTESTVYIGLSNSSDMSHNNAYSVEQVDIPPEFLELEDDSSRFRHDIAVVTLIPNGRDEGVFDEQGNQVLNSSMTETIKWMKVNVNNDIPKTWSIVRVAGYGNTNGDINTPSNPNRALYQVDLPVVSAEHCKPVYGGAVDYEYQMCAGYVGQGGCDACQGDSGGPMFQYDIEGNPVVVGVVSMSLATDCGSSHVPGAYVRTAPHARIFVGKQGVETVTETNPVMTDFRPPPTFRRIIILVLASVAAVTAVMILAVGIVRLGRKRHCQKGSTSHTTTHDSPQPPPSSAPPVQAQSAHPEPTPSLPTPCDPSNRSPTEPETTAEVTAPDPSSTHLAEPSPSPPLPQDVEDYEPLHALDVRARELYPSITDMSLTYDPYACTQTFSEPANITKGR